MAKGVGLDGGEFEVKVVELDGSYRKPRLVKANVDRVSQLTTSASDPGHAAEEATALQHAVKDGGVSKQNVCLGFSSREALFRQLHVPFTGEERIRKVIKFEAEGEIHSQSVDDMVIDFHIVEEHDGETRVLVAGVPKQPLRTTLSALEKVGIEPERVDLDAMGLYRVAEWCGALHPDSVTAEDAVDAVDAEDAVEEVPEGPSSRVVLDLGARAVRMLVVSGGHLLDMRAIPLGCDSIAEDIAARFDVSAEQGREAMFHCLSTGTDFGASAEFVVVEDYDAMDGGPDEDEASESTGIAASTLVTHDAVADARDRFLQRLRREFMRFLVAVKGIGQIEACFTTGAGSLLPGVQELLEDVFGCEPGPLSFMHLMSHTLDEEDVEYMEPRIAVAVGLALGQMNGVKGFNFRQEDLIFTRGFDRMKLPLAIACMLALFYLFFHGVGLRKELRAKEQLFGYAVDKTAKGASTGRQTGKTIKNYKQFTGRLNYLVNDGRWPERTMPHNEYRAMVNRIAAQPTFARINYYRSELKKYLKKVQKKGQYEPSLALDSGVAALEQWAGVIQSVEKRLGRFYVGVIDLSVPVRAKGRSLGFKVFIRGADFTERSLILKNAFDEAFQSQDSAFDGWLKPVVEAPVSGENVGCFYDYSIKLRGSIPVQKL